VLEKAKGLVRPTVLEKAKGLVRPTVLEKAKGLVLGSHSQLGWEWASESELVLGLHLLR